MANPTTKAGYLFPSVTVAAAEGFKVIPSTVLAKTLFYNGYHFAIKELTGFMFKEPLKFGTKIRRIAMGLTEIEDYKDPQGDEFKVKIPKIPNLIEQEYGTDIKLRVPNMISALQNADKFSASDYQLYIEGLKGQVQNVIDCIPYTLLLGMAALVDATQEKMDENWDGSGKHLDTTKITLGEFFTDNIKKITKQTGVAKINDGVIWNDISEDLKKFAKIGLNVWVNDDTNNDDKLKTNGEIGATNYNVFLIQLVKNMYRVIKQLTSPFPCGSNTMDTGPGKEKDQIHPTNCKPEDLIVLMNRTDNINIPTVFLQGIPYIQEYLNLGKLGVTIIPIDGFPSGCFWAFDKYLINAHMQYEAHLSYTDIDTATVKTQTHFRFKYGFLSKVAGILYITKTPKLPALKKKSN